MTPPLVSIVTPTYNSVRYLEDLLRSVEAQDYAMIEHIVIDDGSTDDGATARLLRRYPAVKWWSRENRGQYATLNEGFRAATGDFITTISADDTYADPQAVSAMAEFLTAHPDCDVVHGYTRHMQADGTPVPVEKYQRYPSWMLRYNLGFISHCSLLVRRDRLIRDDLLFDESLRYLGDADWLIRLYLQKYRFCRIERQVAAYRHHEQQVTTTATADPGAEMRRREERDRIFRRYRSSLFVARLVGAYDTCQQRRVKALDAWRRGGSVQLLKTTYRWMQRRYRRNPRAAETQRPDSLT